MIESGIASSESKHLINFQNITKKKLLSGTPLAGKDLSIYQSNIYIWPNLLFLF